MWPELKMTPLETKDLITISLSSFAFLISVAVAGFNWWSWKKKNLEDAKKALTEAIVGMITGRQKLDEFRYQSGEKFGNIESLSYRISLSDQRQLYLSKAMQTLDKYKHRLSPSYAEYMMLAANLIDLGRTADSVRFYENALRLAKANNDHIALAAVRRVYGRAKIASGEYDQGRKEMLAAVDDYRKLASQREYDRDRMFEEAAETYRRLIWVEIQAGRMAAVGSDFSAMEELTKSVKDPIRLRALNSGQNELRKVISAQSSAAPSDTLRSTTSSSTSDQQ